jgi:hypothetical protein
VIEVEIVGGPHDGEIWALPNAQTPLRVPVATASLWEHDIPFTLADPAYRVVEMYPKLTRNGWRLLWREPC